MYYDVLIYCLHTKSKDSVKKITMLNKHLLINIGEKEHIMPRLLYIIYLPLPDDAEDILRWSVKNGLIYVEIGKSI